LNFQTRSDFNFLPI